MTGWIVIVGLSLGCYALKAAGPLVLGERELPGWLRQLSMLAPAALIAALAATATVASNRDLVLDARVAGVIAAAIALWRKAGFVTVVIVAAATTAAVRALTG
jgi:branched-subunit amino acid transport protein